MKPDEELPIIPETYELIIWLIPKIGEFPRDLRFTLGEKIERKLLDVLEWLIRARYTNERSQLLDRANLELEVLRYLLRMAHELKALPTKAYGDSAKRITEIGRQLGGWRKSAMVGAIR